jgi:hypothetical protein
MMKMQWLSLAILISISACSLDPLVDQSSAVGRTVCDSYIVLDMCVQDIVGDQQVDMIYFIDTKEIFMYREGMKEQVGQLMPFHRCAIHLSADMQATTNRILDRKNLSFTEELAITKDLLANYLAARPTIEACEAEIRAREGKTLFPPKEDNFYMDEQDWEDL